MMRCWLASAAIFLCGVPVVSAQGSKQFIQVELLKTIKAKKAKIGDVVKARARQAVSLPGGVTIPEESTVLGEVRAVDENSLAISFDQAEVNGKTIPVKLSIVSAMLPGVAAAQPNTGGENTSVDDANPGNRPMRGGVPHARTVTEQTAPDGSAPSGSPVAGHTGLVIGMPGVTLAVDDGPQHASKFVSAGKELQLKSGLQLMLAVVQ
jgi:hypothetical protein